jgi:hypothetical protein
MEIADSADCNIQNSSKVGFIGLIGIRFPALRGFGPYYEAGSGDFYGRRLRDGAMEINRSVFH